MKTATVHVDLHQVGLLAHRLGTVARLLETRAVRLGTMAAPSGLDPSPRRRLLEVAAWADDQCRALRTMAADLRRLDGAERAALRLTLSDRRHDAFADPVAAHAAATRAVRLLGEGSTESLREAGSLLTRFGDDPVFAVVVLDRIGPTGVASVLHRADRRWAEGRSEDRAVVGGLARALASAMRIGIEPFGWRDLVAATAERPTGSRSAGLLFLVPASFTTATLVGAVRHLVVPWNRAGVERPGAGSALWSVAGPEGLIDLRASVLRRVATDPQAARTVVATSDLDDLLPARLGHADGGLALAELLVAGTAPVDLRTGRLIGAPLVTGDRPATALSASNLRKVVGWMAASGRTPVMVEMSVDRLLGPWIGSIRGAGLDEVLPVHVSLDEGAARRVLTAGMQFAAVRDRLVASAWLWARTESARLAREPVSGAGHDAIGSVLGIVSIEAHDARVVDLAASDEQRSRQRALWSQLQRELSKPLPKQVALPVSLLARRTRDAIFPSTDLELDHWAQHRDHAVGREALAFESMILDSLWEARADNGYFTGDAVGPPAFLLRRTDRGPRLRALEDLDQREVSEYLAWRSRLADGRPAPLQLATERFFAEGREAPV